MRLDVTTERAQHPSVASGAYDIALVAGSWDSRSLMFNSFDVAVGVTVVLTLSASLFSSKVQENQASLLAKARACSTKVVEVEADRSTPNQALREVVRVVRSEAAIAGRPLRVLVDLAGTSRYVSLGLLAATMSDGSAVDVSFSYATTRGYAPSTDPAADAYVFRSGKWFPSAIPGLGKPAGAGKQRLVVSAGFEGRRTRRLVDLLEPDVVEIVVSDSPLAGNNAVLSQQVPLLRGAVSASKQREVHFPVGEVAGLADYVHRLANDTSAGDRLSTSALLAGPKSAGLAMAVSALRGGVSNVFYVRSERHEEVDVAGIDAYYLYRIAPSWARSLLTGARYL